MNTLICPRCLNNEVARVQGLIWHCFMCGTLSICQGLSENMERLVEISTPRYYGYFQDLQDIVKSENSDTQKIAKNCIKALRAFHK